MMIKSLPHPATVRPIRDNDWPAGREPALDEVLADPLVHLVMRRDGVTQVALRRVVAEARAGLGYDRCRCRAA